MNKYGDVIENASLINYNTYGINATCKYLVKPNSIENLIELLKYLKDNELKYYILGMVQMLYFQIIYLMV